MYELSFRLEIKLSPALQEPQARTSTAAPMMKSVWSRMTDTNGWSGPKEAVGGITERPNQDHPGKNGAE